MMINSADAISLGSNSRISIEPQGGENVLTTNRKTTNAKVIYFLAFVLVGLIGYFNLEGLTELLQSLGFYLLSLIQQSTTPILTWHFLADIVMIIFYVLLLLSVSKTMGYFVIMYDIIVTIYLISHLFQDSHLMYQHYVYIVLAIIKTGLLGISVFCIPTYHNIMLAMLKKSCRAFFFCRSLILFALAFLLLSLVVILLFLNSTDFGMLSENLFIKIYISLYVMNVLYYFERAVVSHITAVSYWAADKKGSCFLALWRSIATIFRYHLGTIMLSSLWPLPIFYSIYVVGEDEYRTSPKSGNVVMRFICQIMGIGCAPNLALALTSAKGCSYYEANKRAISLIMKNSKLSIAVLHFMELILVFGVINVIIGNIALNSLLCDDYYDFHFFRFVCITEIILILPIFAVIDSVMKTVFLCTLDDKKIDEPLETLSHVSRPQ